MTDQSLPGDAERDSELHAVRQEVPDTVMPEDHPEHGAPRAREQRVLTQEEIDEADGPAEPASSTDDNLPAATPRDVL